MDLLHDARVFQLGEQSICSYVVTRCVLAAGSEISPVNNNDIIMAAED